MTDSAPPAGVELTELDEAMLKAGMPQVPVSYVVKSYRDLAGAIRERATDVEGAAWLCEFIADGLAEHLYRAAREGTPATDPRATQRPQEDP